MSMKHLVFSQAKLMTGELDARKTALLEVLCGTASDFLEARLKVGMRPEDCAEAFVAAASLLLFRQKLSGKAWIAIALTFGGSIVVALAGSVAGADVLKGNLLGLAAGATMAVYTMIGTVCRKTVSTTVYTFVVYLAAAATVLAIALSNGTPVAGYGHLNYLTALGMAVFCTLLGHSVFSWGLKYLPPAYISTVKLLDPVFSALWGLLLFQEKPTLLVILGGAAIIFGIALYSRSIETT